MIDDNQHDAPCKHGNIVDRHACFASQKERSEICEANAHLIAAAPELLEALRRLALAVESIASHEPGATRDEMIERLHLGYENQLIAARAAIAKAKGNL